MRLRLFSSFIIKTKNPCISCIHYIDERLQYPPDSYFSETRFGWCSKFGKEHLVTGEINYEDAIVCRTHESKCGKDGRYYTKIIKNTVTTLKNNKP